MLVVMRRFWIEQGSFDEFERLSREEIWPAIEAAGARILGMFRAEEPHPNEEVTRALRHGDPADAVHRPGPLACDSRSRRDTWRGPEDVQATGWRGVVGPGTN